MVINKINPIVNDTATLLKTDTAIVTHVLKHMFTEIGSYLQNPTKAGYRITYLGLISPHKKALLSRIKWLITRIRRKDDLYDSYVTEFRKLWNLRLLLHKDLKRRKVKRNE